MGELTPSGFAPYCLQLPVSRSSLGWFIERVVYNANDDGLLLSVSEAIPISSRQKARKMAIAISKPVSFRVLDERELTHYWEERTNEDVDPSTSIYEISSSAYREEALQHSLKDPGSHLTHILFAGSDTCVEVIACDITTIALNDLSGEDL